MSKNGSMTPQKTVASKGNASQKKALTLLLRWIGGGALVLGFFLYYFHPMMMPFGVALVCAYVLNPAVQFFEKKGIERATITFFMVLSSLIFFATILFFIIPFLKTELQALATTLPQHINTLLDTFIPPIQSWVLAFSGDIQTDIQKTITDNLSKMLTWVLMFLASLFTNTLALANLVALVLLTPLLIFYLLRDWPKMIHFIHTLMPPTLRPSLSHLSADINTTLSGYFRGQASICLLMTLYYTVSLSLLGLKFSVTVGMVSGLLAFIPYVGFFTGFIAALGIAMSQFTSIDPILIVMLIYVLGHTVEAFFLTPKMVGDRIGLHPVWVIFALLGGGFAMGFTGLLLAIPVSAILAVLLRFAMNKYRQHLKDYS